MKGFCSGLLVALLFCLAPAAAQETPWGKAEAIVRATYPDIQKAGFRGLEPHIAELEKTLAEGAAAFPSTPGPDGKSVMLVTSSAEALGAMLLAAQKKIAALAVNNPYPEVGLLLMEYYVEVRQPEEALRVQAATLKLRVIPDLPGPMDATIFTETAAALSSLRRWDEGLAAADQALAASQNDRDKARSQRSRGFALIELQRLDDAEAAYRESLKLEPNNPIAMNEMGYIARQRAGGPRTAPTLVAPNDPTKPPVQDQLNPPAPVPAQPPPTPTVPGQPPI